MKKRQSRTLINAAYGLLSNSFNVKTNVVKINVGNTLQHEMAKFIKTFELIKDGKVVITEAIFKNGSRADIFNMTDLQIFEILHSEKMEEALQKKDYYPSECDIFFLKSNEVIENAR